MENYVCPAEYNCTCRPVGRAVTRRTHFRHRQLANEQRTKFSLPSLDIGSRFSEAVSNTEVSRHTQLFEEYLTQPLYETPEANFRNAVHSSTRITFVSDFEGVRHVLHVGDFTPPAQHLREHFASREVQYTLSQSQSEGSRRRRGATAPNHFMDLNLPEASISVAASQTVDGRYESDAGEVRSLHMRAGSDSGEEDILACTSGPTFRASSRERFLSFRAENKEWIEFGIEFSLNKAAMKRILQIIEAPYKVWETVERNIKKYGPLSTVKFSICNRHMLLGPYLEIGGTCKKYSPSDCVICKGNPSTFDIDTFEYIPLKNRLRNWLKSEKSCKLLYEYRKRIVTERSTEHGNYYGDIVDGSLYKRIIESRGGEEAAKYDIFLSLSTDGFQTFGNKSYDTWPIIALLHNLPPSCRFLMKNIIQFGFVKGPHENIKLDTYFRPLVDEINDLNANGGTMFEFYDGEKRRVMVHIVWIGGDSPAVAKVGGLKGVNGVSPCRICDILGHWLAEALHCYSPSRVKLLREGDSVVRIKRYYDPANLSLRVVEQSESTFRILQDMSLTKRRRDRIAKATGITGRTVLYDLPSIVPFESFPLDIMHLIYNIGKDFLVLWKGLHAHFKPGDPDNDFIISREGWKVIDAELCELGKGTSQSWFGRRPRDTSKFENWKAEEFKTFFLIYAPVVLEGHIFPKYLEGVKMLSSLFDLCFRPQLTKEDLERISSGALLFFNHFENDYFKFIESRARLCKSTIHALLHLAETVKRCGPLVLCNQFYMERFNGYAKNRLNATVKAAESLTEGAKLSESNKLLQGEHFAVSDEVDPRSDEEEQDDNDVENDTNCTSSFKSGKFENLSSTFSRHFRVRELMVKYAMRAKNISQDAARASMQDEEYNLVGRAKVKCGEGTVVFGSRYLGRKNRKRANYYVVAGFEEDENKFEVFYGQVLFFIQYEFRFSTGTEKRDLFVGEWISGLMTNDMEHLFTENRGSRLFRQRSVEDISVILHGFGILEHRHSGKNRKCTYILDPQLRIHHLLDLDKASPDGMNRVAYGVHWD